MRSATATQAILRAKMQRPDLFRLLRPELGLTPQEIQVQEATIALEILFGGDAPSCGVGGF